MPDKPKKRKMSDTEWIRQIQAQRQRRANTGTMTREEDAVYMKHLNELRGKGRQADRIIQRERPSIGVSIGQAKIEKPKKPPKKVKAKGGSITMRDKPKRVKVTIGQAKIEKPTKKVARKAKKKKRGKT